jgi:hypothetical protein
LDDKTRRTYLELHVGGEAADVVVGLDGSTGALVADGLDHVGVQRALQQEVALPDLVRLLFAVKSE